MENSGESDKKPRNVTSGRKSVDSQVAEIKFGLSGLFGAVGKLVRNFDQFDGDIILMGSPDFIDACCRAAQTDARFRGYMLSLIHVSAYSDMAFYASAMLIPIAMHHGLLDFIMPRKPVVESASNGVYQSN